MPPCVMSLSIPPGKVPRARCCGRSPTAPTGRPGNAPLQCVGSPARPGSTIRARGAPSSRCLSAGSWSWWWTGRAGGRRPCGSSPTTAPTAVAASAGCGRVVRPQSPVDNLWITCGQPLNLPVDKPSTKFRSGSSPVRSGRMVRSVVGAWCAPLYEGVLKGKALKGRAATATTATADPTADAVGSRSAHEQSWGC